MAAQLGELHAAGAVHGDVGAAGLVLDASGIVCLPVPALRGVVRPCEGYSFCDLQPEAYDYLPPERVADGSEPTVAGDWYACGLLWWHLLTGRAPLAGGNSLARLEAAHAGRIVAVRQLAPDVSSTSTKRSPRAWCAIGATGPGRPIRYGNLRPIPPPAVPRKTGSRAQSEPARGKASRIEQAIGLVRQSGRSPWGSR